MKYEHKTQYYETDQMGIIHHSNYIRWFEEARIDFMDHCGFSYAQMEKDGLISPGPCQSRCGNCYWRRYRCGDRKRRYCSYEE